MEQAKYQPILKTLAFFDVVGMPVSFAAVRRWLWGRAELKPEELKSVIDWHATLGNRTTLREDGTIALIQKSRPWLKLLAMWPGVEALYLCNSVAFMNANEQSDIDVFIVTKPGQVWSTRFVLTALLQLLGKRPKPGKEAGTVCLSFFVASDVLDLKAVALPQDVYFAYWLATLIPAFDPHDVEKRLLEINLDLLPNSSINTFRRVQEAKLSSFFVATSRFVLWPAMLFSRAVSPVLKHWQQRRFPKEILHAERQPDRRVVLSDTMLKFHTNDRREEYKRAWQKRYEDLEKQYTATMA